jgi:hypothetical protein
MEKVAAAAPAAQPMWRRLSTAVGITTDPQHAAQQLQVGSPLARICTGTGAHPAHICTGTGAHPAHIGAGTGAHPAHIGARTGLQLAAQPSPGGFSSSLSARP